jgi:SAM-dependent methyltransferase
MAAPDWENYAVQRASTRHRLLAASHVEAIDDFLRFSATRNPVERVVDVGAGKGLFLVLLRELGFQELCGVDVSKTHVAMMQAKGLQAVAGNIQTGEGLDALSPPFDLAILMEVLEHMEDPDRALRNLRGLVARTGSVYMTVPMCGCLFNRLRRVRDGLTREGQVKNGDPTHLHAFSEETLNPLLERNGFRVAYQRRLGFEWPGRLAYYPGRRLHLLFRALLPARLKGNHLATVACPA